MAARSSTRSSNCRMSTAATPSDLLEPGTLVWVPCPKSGFRRATVVSVVDDDHVFVDCVRDQADPSSGGQKRIQRSEARPFYDPGSDRPNGSADSTELVYLDDANILQNMHIRFLTDNIYTYTANVLLAVNPYKQMGHLYTNDVMGEYKNIRNAGTKPPHPYAIADTAYRHLQREWRHQALLISGESGAGKTETAKITMKYLADVSRTDAARGVRIQDKIINANPILESFGNAQTVRNRNSSRFGKYNEMHFNRVGSLVGAGIKTYLLESSRVVSQQEGEQNYHVFYQMLYGLDSDTLKYMNLDTDRKYQLLYTSKAQVPEASSRDFLRGSEEFSLLRQALDVVGLDNEMLSDIFEVVAALIHLGEVEFGAVAGMETQSAQPDLAVDEALASDSTQAPLVEVLQEAEIAHASKLLGFSETQLLSVLKWKDMKVARQQAHIAIPRTKSQSYQTLHSIIRVLYKRLFEQIVALINNSSSAQREEHLGMDDSDDFHANIGTLDIYGFERLTVNSFEQLCINLANERLQQFFVEEVLVAEQIMYAKESIQVPACDLPDSTPVVSSIQNVMSVLDDHSKRFFRNLVKLGGHTDPDQKFCENLYRDHITGQCSTCPLVPLKLKASKRVGLNDGFIVRHYAGEVEYRTLGWIQKNNDALVPQIEALFTSSQKKIVRNLSGPDTSDVAFGERFTSVSSNYLGNLTDLLTTLHRCKLHYIRCFNPNDKRAPGVFNTKYVLDQVVQCGTVELVNIMHNGYPNRCKLVDIRKRFSNLLPAEFQQYTDRDFVEAILLAFEIDKTQWTVGLSRLFLKAGQLRVLEHLLDSGSEASREMLKKIRRHFVQKKWRRARTAVLFALWLPKEFRRLRTVTVRTALRKVCFIYVRLARWRDRARKTLWGYETRRPSIAIARPDADVKQFPFPSTFGNQRLQIPSLRRAEVFFALNRHEKQGDLLGSMQSQIDSQKQVQDAVLSLWQQAITENVLYYDGKHLVSTRLDPKMFLVRDHAAIGQSRDGCLTDVRYIDVGDTGLAMKNRAALSEDSEIICMCQHRRNSNIFATCHKTFVLIWNWFGTDQVDVDKSAIMVDGGFVRDEDGSIVYGMCFLSDVPENIAREDGRVVVLLTGRPYRPWLTITFLAVYRCGHRIICIQNVGVNGSLLEAARCGNLIFKISQSDRILIVGGKNKTVFFEIQRTAPTDVNDAGLSLRLVYVENYELTFVSCLCSGPPKATNAKDWIVFSDDQGELYGFIFDERAGRIHLRENGRFSSKLGARHEDGIPVSILIPTHGSTPQCHYSKIKDSGISYISFLESLQSDTEHFFSLGDDGKLMGWNFTKRGWSGEAQEGLQVDAEWDGSRRRYVAAQCSRLVPHVLVVVEQGRRIRCLDTLTLQKRERGGPLEAMCNLGGA